MSNPINPFEQPDPLTHKDFQETITEAFQDWLAKNPRTLPQDIPWTYRQLFNLLVRTNAEQIDSYLRDRSE
jgi:hypothetical protein